MLKSTLLLSSLLPLCVIAGQQNPYSSRPVDTPPKVSAELPDISRYNQAFFHEQLSSWSHQAEITLQRLPEQGLLRRFQLITDMTLQAKAQGAVPQILVIENGLASLEDIAAKFPHALIPDESKPNTYLARFPILVRGDAAILIDDGEELRLSEERRTFLVGGGEFFVLDATINSWRESTNSPSYWSGNKSDYRAFYSVWNGSKTFFYNSSFESLGYFRTKAYGISLASQKLSDHELQTMPWMENTRSTGVLMNNKFIDIYYGFYCYKAEDVVILGNEYIDNVVYGIDPHDYSERLVIAKNITHGTLQKHGIIISREVNNSFIFDNISFNNHRSGIMLDRSSENNLIVNNRTFDNGGDGITLQESNNNFVINNLAYNNQEHGINIRNSQHISLYNNKLIANGGAGIYGHTDNLSEHTHRDLTLDPFTAKVSFTASGGSIIANKSAAINVSDFEFATLGNISFGENGNSYNTNFLGDLKPFFEVFAQNVNDATALQVQKTKD
ncbi:right-handed parallel beta-helix repeat-containing protein [Vibrio ponticus]|uniref:Right-handed parallel beta-helix repeat-containing protein n=1 Tax=Vibrio ponticus TaxID=265668 RepID=A0A3N3E235_9VIBR|nr:NosD domain-containing protein [Vibrio ponticus]ROV60660.1 right-handed parallel beta-helix repeat-containing protein [Vibrio ponticus]